MKSSFWNTLRWSFQWSSHIRQQIWCPLISFAVSLLFIFTSVVTERELWKKYTAPIYIQIKRQWQQTRHEKIILERMGKQRRSKWKHK